MSRRNTKKTSREVMLERIQVALRDVPGDEQPEVLLVERSYRHKDTASDEERIERFVERVTDYKAVVHRVEERELPVAIATCCNARDIRRLVVPTDIPSVWFPEGIELLSDAVTPLTYEQLDSSDGVLTGCAVGIAQTGTIVLDGGKMQGRRVLTLLPDYALCVIWEEQIVSLVPQAIQQLEAAVRVRRQPLTFISGPSATSDIELSRVEGVHGPRTLEVLVVHPVGVSFMIPSFGL
ncbi:MAG: LUD domain-containing protein [Ktedonobacteraceae bacterium]